MTATACMYFKANTELVMGDSASVSLTRGNIYSVNMAYSDAPLLKFPAAAGTPAGDQEGPKIINLSGISREVEMDEVVLEEQDATVNLGYIKQAHLQYGNIANACAENIVKCEFLDYGNEKRFPKVEDCDYSTLSIFSKDGIDFDNYPTLKTGDGEVKSIPLDVNAVGSEQSKKFFGAQAMEGYESITVPSLVETFIKTGGTVSNVIYNRGKGRLNVEQFETTSKNIYYCVDHAANYICKANRSVNVMSSTESANSVVAAQISSAARGTLLSVIVNFMDMENKFGTFKNGVSFYSVDNSTEYSARFKQALGPKFYSSAAPYVTSAAAKIEQRIASLESTVAGIRKNEISMSKSTFSMEENVAQICRTLLAYDDADLKVDGSRFIAHV